MNINTTIFNKTNILDIKEYDFTNFVNTVEILNKKETNILFKIAYAIMAMSGITCVMLFNSFNFAQFNFSFLNIFILILQLTVGVLSGGIISLFTLLLGEKAIYKFKTLKSIQKQKSDIIEKVANLCEEKNFQFSLLKYFKHYSEQINCFQFKDNNLESNRQTNSPTLQRIYNELIVSFANKNFHKASETLMNPYHLSAIKECLELLDKKNSHEYVNIADIIKPVCIVDTYMKDFLSSVEQTNLQNEIVEKEYEYKNYL